MSHAKLWSRGINHFILVLVFLTAIFLFFGALAAMVSAQSPKVVRVGAYDNPPKISVDENGNVSGFWGDLLAYIAAEEGWQIEYVPGTWNDGLANLQSGAIDIMPDVAFTEDRAAKYAFSDAPVLVSWTRLYVAQDNTGIQTVQELDGKKVAALAGSVNLNGPAGLYELIRGFDLHVTVEEMDDYQSVFRAIESGEVDAGITNRNFGDKFAGDYAVKSTSIIFQPINMKFALPKNSPTTDYFLKRINQEMATLKNDNNSIYYDLLAKYFETSIAEKEVVPRWLQLTMQFGVVLLIAFGLAFVTARIQITRQTREIRDKNEALAAEKERLAVTLNSIGDGVIATDNNGTIVLINKIAERLTGWTRRDAIGKPLLDVFHIIDARSGNMRHDPVSKVLTSGRIVGLANHMVLVAKDGTRRSIADSGAPIFDADSQVIGVILVFRDVTEKEKNEAAIMKTKKLESVGVLAGGIAHDFNNILTAILGNISLARMHVSSENDAFELLVEAEKASLRARDLTQQLLTFSKGGDPVKKTTAIEKVVVESAEFVLHGTSVACTFECIDDLWLVDADAGQTSQVIQNIVLNARDAMPTGGIVTIKCTNIPDIHTEKPNLPDGKYIRISISDTGSGIPEKYLSQVFDPYFSTKQQGNGLGLAITHAIIRKHDGDIDVRSVMGQGTTFSIYLPASEQQLPDQPSTEPAKAQPISAKILIMDDEQIVRDVLRSVLESFGFTVIATEDGSEAIAVYREHWEDNSPFDAVIMDLTVPGGMGGENAVQGVLNINPAAKVIVSSGYSNDPILANYQDYGFSGAIVKPFQIEDLEATLDEVLS